MSIIDIIKKCFNGNKSNTTKMIEKPDQGYYERLEQKKKSFSNEKILLEHLRKDYEKMQESDSSKASSEYKKIHNQISMLEYMIKQHELELGFIRPNSLEDIEYRNYQANNFVKKLKEIQGLPDRLDLRFHGTQIYLAEQIIKDGKISARADMNEYLEEQAFKKETIWASNIESVGWTVKSFTNLTDYERKLPCGCVFALLPKDKEDANLGEDILYAVDFRKNPQQLYGIFTSPENIQRVKEWMRNSGFDPDIVYTFEGFLKTVKKDTKRRFVEKVDVPSNHGILSRFKGTQTRENEKEEGRID